MTRRDDYRDELLRLDPAAWPAYLDARSGLPGPRGNIELAQAVADLDDPAIFDDLIASGDEYRTFCGVVGLGNRAGDPPVTSRLRDLATDDRWRVREAVAMALQRLGDRDLARLLDIVSDWAEDPHPLVQRAAAAAICEPRLIMTPAAAAVALRTCERATELLALRPSGTRRDQDVRTLRQALGYCWSVAVAADPGPGLERFAALRGGEDPDVVWIVRENLRKKRLARLL